MRCCRWDSFIVEHGHARSPSKITKPKINIKGGGGGEGGGGGVREEGNRTKDSERLGIYACRESMVVCVG